jgi:hypothetical protein
MRHWITSFRFVDGTPNVERKRPTCKGLEQTGFSRTGREAQLPVKLRPAGATIVAPDPVIS